MATNYPIVKSTFEGYPLTPLQHANTRVSAEQGDVIHKAGEELSWSLIGFTLTIYTGMITCGGYLGEVTSPVVITLTPGGFNTVYMETNLSTGEILIGHQYSLSPIVLTNQDLVTYGTGVRQVPLLEFYCSDTKPDWVMDWMPKYRASNKNTGWKDIVLSAGIVDYTTGAKPQYRIVDGKIEMRGAVKKSNSSAFTQSYVSVFACADILPYVSTNSREVDYDTGVLLASSAGRPGLRGFFNPAGVFFVASADTTNHPIYCLLNSSIILPEYKPMQVAL